MDDNKLESIDQQIISEKLMQLHNDSIKAEETIIVSSNESLYPRQISENNIKLAIQNIEIMNRYKDLFAHRILTSHRKYVGKLIIYGKKVVRKLLKWYINPITDQQTLFNNSVVNTINSFTESFESLILKNETQVLKISELESNIGRQHSEFEVQIKRQHSEFEFQIGTINHELEVKIAKIEELENGKIERNNQEKNQIARIDELENTLEKLSKTLDISVTDQNSFFDKNSYAQSGEDTILAYVFYVLGIKVEDITYLDLGANHAKELSNTYYFYKKGAKGVLIEANPELIQELKYYRYNDIILNRAVGTDERDEIDFYVLSGDGLSTVSLDAALDFCKMNDTLKITNQYKIKTISVNEIMDKYLGKAPTFISIDLEGIELEVLKSIDFVNYRPVIIIVETIEYRPYLTTGIRNYETMEYLNTKGYTEYAFTGINSIFIDLERLEKNR